jgi:hypothetical protein
VRDGHFRGFELDDLWEIYEAENPLAEIVSRVSEAYLNDTSGEFRDWAVGAWERRPRMLRTFHSV